MNDKTIIKLVQEGLIIFSKNGKIESVKAPDYGEVVLRYKGGQPYSAAVTENKKL